MYFYTFSQTPEIKHYKQEGIDAMQKFLKNYVGAATTFTVAGLLFVATALTLTGTSR